MSFADYQSAYTATAGYSHKMVYGDKMTDDLLGLAKTFISQIPTLKCRDPLGQDLYYVSQLWDKVFNHPSDSIVFGLLGFNLATKSEALYYCLDTARAPAILNLIVKAGIPIPKEVLEAYSMINKIQNALNFLNIHLRFEGMLVTTADYTVYRAASTTSWLDA